jgi:multicomponent Na+:H+ antiporter subunit E
VAEEKNGVEGSPESWSRFFMLGNRILGAAPFMLTFLFCITTWIILSGKFDLFHLTLGVISSIIVAYQSAGLVFTSPDLKDFIGNTFRFARYIPWLLYQVFAANLHVMYLVFHPRMMEVIDPRIITFKSRLEKEISHLIFANSITLTPGTITVYVSGIYGDYTVHVIDTQSGENLPGEMETRVGRVFGE